MMTQSDWRTTVTYGALRLNQEVRGRIPVLQELMRKEEVLFAREQLASLCHPLQQKNES
jgi:hypothetical protein